MSIEIETKEQFDVECGSCGASLEASIVRSNRWGSTPTMTITPCEKCMEAAADKAREEAMGEQQ